MEDLYLIINARRHNSMITKEIAQDFFDATGKTIFRQTVYRNSAEKALYAQRPDVPLNPSLIEKLVINEA
ncbi:hypothetical protein TNCV_4016901 [Trichonephila clavipes]|nr:hypothetical protein TNCV_4016901 [Trichonephila clavipes]